MTCRTAINRPYTVTPCCDRPGLRIRGYCIDCMPSLHAEHNALLALYADAADAYQRETGRHPLADTDHFDAWYRARAEGEAHA